MPLDTLAREAVWNVTGKGSVWGVDPVAMVLGWTFDPSAWEVQPIVRVADRALAEAIALPHGTSWSSFRDLAANERLASLANEAQAAEQQERPLTKLQKSAQKLEGRLYWMMQFFRHEAILAVPAQKPGEAWTSPDPLRSAADLRAVLDSGVSAGRLAPGRLSAEVLYNRVGHTRIAWWVLSLSLLLSIAAMILDRRALDLAAGAALFAGFGVMSWGIWMRWQVAGRIPASNMYESMLFLALGRRLLRGHRDGAHAQPPRGPERRRRRRDRDGPHGPPADRPVHPPDAAGALGHLLARDPRADHHGRLRGAGARHGGRPHADRGRGLRPCPPDAGR